MNKIIELIVGEYYDLDMSEEDCIIQFLYDLHENYDYDVIETFIDDLEGVKSETINTKQ